MKTVFKYVEVIKSDEKECENCHKPLVDKLDEIDFTNIMGSISSICSIRVWECSECQILFVSSSNKIDKAELIKAVKESLKVEG